MKLRLFSILLLVAPSVRASAAETPDFERDVLPLVKNRCVKCHGPAKREGGLNLSHISGLARGGDSGRAIVPGDSMASLIWKRVAADEMPEDEPLSAAEKQVLRHWIDAGARGLPAGPSPDDEHWSFRKLRQTRRPNVRDVGRTLGAIDRHIQAGLERRQLALGGPTDRGRLLRRLSFDLIGLPPGPQQLDTFADDASPDATERMVDRLLASPQYGERYGRHWLDAAGYADSNGYFFADTDRPLAYKYRDYVIRAFNRDKPFDRFVQEQLAGDELTGYHPAGRITQEMVEGLTATHFLRNGPDGTGESDGNPDEVLADKYFVLEASLQIVGTSLLGMTVQCARCHDHKFEPLSQRDYYQLQAIIYPAFNPERWLKPAERVVDAATSAERAAWRRMQPEAADLVRLAGRANDMAFRRGAPQTKIAFVRDESGDPPEVWLLDRGVYRARKEKVPAAAPAVLCGDNHVVCTEPSLGVSGSTGRRLSFAKWLTQPNSRPSALLARVTVNRLWQNHFGTGIAPSVDNLGYSGTPPTHPELLEYLAGELVRSGWSIKHVQRMIVSSVTYRQSSRPHPAGMKADPANSLLWRFPLRRLDAESVRDAMLSASGQLDERMRGLYVPTNQTGLGEVVVDESTRGARRRSVYLQQRRMQVPSVLAVFDAPLMVYNCTRRNSTTIPLQSLSLLNSEFARSRAKALAKRVQCGSSDAEAALTTLFTLAVARPPTKTERSSAVRFLQDQPGDYIGRPDALGAAWIDLCQAVLASNAFLYVE